MQTYLALGFYLVLVIASGLWSSRGVKTSSDFVIGSRSLNYWLTAMSAHASDMSSWLFMAYPAVILTGGLFNAWTALGLMLCMWFNWTFIAPKIRTQTEKLNCNTMSSFFEKRFQDSSGILGILSAIFCLFFYSVYICAGLVSLGLLFENLFGLPYLFGISLGSLIVIAYVVLGGYIAIAWLDLIQGLFLLAVILFVPIYLYNLHGGLEMLSAQVFHPTQGLAFLPDLKGTTGLSILSMVFGWGLGYFGQPHIITKFMGINHVSEMHKSKIVGMIWMLFALMGATAVGLIGQVLAGDTPKDPQMIFIDLVQKAFHPFFVGLVLCAIIAATINVMCSQILVLSSTISEDLYRRVIKTPPTSQQLLRISRWGVVAVALIAFCIAYMNFKSIYALVLYAWSGLGASFGPLLVYSLYAKRFNRFAAYVGMVSGGVVSALWPLLDAYTPVQINALVPAFIVSFLLIHLTAKIMDQRVRAAEY